MVQVIKCAATFAAKPLEKTHVPDGNSIWYSVCDVRYAYVCKICNIARYYFWGLLVDISSLANAIFRLSFDLVGIFEQKYRCRFIILSGTSLAFMNPHIINLLSNLYKIIHSHSAHTTGMEAREHNLSILFS